MAVEIANLIVTLPSWGVSDHPLADALAKAGPKFWVNVQISPMKMLQLTNDARQRATLRELAAWDEVKDSRALNLIAANPESPEAFAKFDDLVLAIKLRVQRLKYSACDDDTALAFSEVLRACDVDKVGPQEIVIPAKTPGSGMELAKRITERAEDNELCLVLEEVDESGTVAKQLIAARQRVVRLPIFGGVKQTLEQTPENDLPIQVMSSESRRSMRLTANVKTSSNSTSRTSSSRSLTAFLALPILSARPSSRPTARLPSSRKYEIVVVRRGLRLDLPSLSSFDAFFLICTE